MYVDGQGYVRRMKNGDFMAVAMGHNRFISLADPTLSHDTITNNYVDGQDNLRVAKTGDTMSGALAMGGS